MDDARGEGLRARLERAPRSRSHPNQVPRDAATLIIIDRSGPEPRVLMGRRHAGHVFMPGKFVFPGGRIEAGDRLAPSGSELRPEVQAALGRRTQAKAARRGRALALAAIREAFEETGLLLGRKAAVPDAARAAAGPGWDAFLARGILPELGGMSLIARAITPPRRPKRFDTRFFAVDREAIADEVAGVIGPEAELVELVWVDLPAARALDLPPITAVMLDELEHRIGEGMAPGLPVPFYRELRGHFVRELL